MVHVGPPARAYRKHGVAALADDPAKALLQYVQSLDGATFDDALAKALHRNLELGQPWDMPTLISAAHSVALPAIGNGHANGLFANGADTAPVVDEAQVEAIRKALLHDALDTRDAGAHVREEVPGAGGLLHRGVATVMFSDRGAGKTTAVLASGLGAAERGERVLYLDRENGAELTKARVEAFQDAHPEQPDVLESQRFVGRHYPSVSKAWTPESIGVAIADLGFTVVIFDSLREFLSQLGLDPDKEKDISVFFSWAVTPLVQRKVTPVMLDNTGHQEKGRPKGSATKLDAAPLAYAVTTEDQFTPAKPGRVKLACTRSRYGDEGREWSMRVGGGLYEIPATNSTAPEHDIAQQARKRYEKVRTAMIAALSRREPQLRDDLMREVRKLGVRAQSNKIRDLFAEIAADPSTGVGSGTNGYYIEKGP